MKQAKHILMSKLRSKTIDRTEFAKIAHQVGLLLAFESLDLIPTKSHTIITPIETHQGIVPQSRIVLIAILRSGLALLRPFSDIYPDAPIGFIGCERNSLAKTVTTYYQKLPSISKGDFVIILDPVLATGITAEHAIQAVIAHGAQQENILFVSMIASQKGVTFLSKQHPKVRLITAALDQDLTEDGMVTPGLGDFGDRYFQTYE